MEIEWLRLPPTHPGRLFFLVLLGIVKRHSRKEASHVSLLFPNTPRHFPHFLPKKRGGA